MTDEPGPGGDLGLETEPTRAFQGLASDTIWMAGLQILGVLVGICSFIMITRALESTGEYGLFAGLYALATTFSAVTYSGPGLALLQRRFRFNQDLNEIQSSFLSLTILTGVVGTALAVGLAALWIDLPLDEIILVTSSELIANSLIWVCSWLVQIAVSYSAMIKVRMTGAVLKLLGVSALFVTGQLTIRNIGLTYLVMYGAFACWLMVVYLPRIGYTMKFRRPPLDSVRTSSVFAAPLAATQIQSGGDLVVLDAYKLETDAGNYSAAFRLVSYAALSFEVVGQAAFHRFLPDGENEGPGYHLRRSLQLTGVMLAIGLAAAGGLYLVLTVGTPIIDLLLGEKYSEAKQIIPWLLLFLPLHAISGTPMNGLLGLGRARERAVVYISSALFSVVLYLMLIPSRGWEGAVIATLVSETYLAIVSWVAMVFYQRKADAARRAGGPA